MLNSTVYKAVKAPQFLKSNSFSLNDLKEISLTIT